MAHSVDHQVSWTTVTKSQTHVKSHYHLYAIKRFTVERLFSKQVTQKLAKVKRDPTNKQTYLQ